MPRNHAEVIGAQGAMFLISGAIVPDRVLRRYPKATGTQNAELFTGSERAARLAVAASSGKATGIVTL